MAFYVGRFRDMETKEFEVEVVTPLFLGGVGPGRVELRVPPIKTDRLKTVLADCLDEICLACRSNIAEMDFQKRP
ncbi:MAG: hypothetical protein JRI80_16950 [Deltaproteobacteria bacterium]|nr:hypothetical protein [Deltaproteobacteria bacterium]